MEAVTRRRALWLAIGSLIAYGLAIVLIGFALGFDHGLTQWLFAGAFIAIGIGLLISLSLRLVLFVFDPKFRIVWWTRASPPTRAIRVASLLVRAVAVFVVVNVALGTLRR
jgi:hypothetical protein